ncbi:hypothetical protein [Streptomyces mirabilis]
MEQVEQSTAGLAEGRLFFRLLSLAAEHGGGLLPAGLEQLDEGVAQR